MIWVFVDGKDECEIMILEYDIISQRNISFLE